ncbi:hypothetical protein EEX84_02700 [Planococcus salinus]|uniref:Uncharacterized protein n=1 Tax=Planococcus salinus TaxID=1848460 RepID=A0A3M8P9I0_9BACL|nr:hypothetical protein EEX84_02700 [Planococcus salinus]
MPGPAILGTGRIHCFFLFDANRENADAPQLANRLPPHKTSSPTSTKFQKQKSRNEKRKDMIE